MLELLKSFSGSIQGKRSTALQPLVWVLGTCFTVTLVAVQIRAPEWLVLLFAIICGAIILTAISCYVYLMLKDRDALRSEHFNITKMQIERGLVGDSLSGLASSHKAVVAAQAEKMEVAGNGE